MRSCGTDDIRGNVRGPDQRNFDLTLIKAVPIRWRKGLNLEFRAEFFNAFSTPEFSNPNVTVSEGSAFGRVSTTSVNPRIVQLALKVDF